MLDKLQLWLKSKIGQPYAYYIVCIIYTILIYGGIFLIGYIFDVWYQMLIIGFLFSVIRFFCMGFHCHTNIKCFIISSILLIIFGELSKIIPIWMVFLLCLYSCRNIYQKSPIELNEDFEGKDKDWHFKRVVLIMVIYLIISLILYYFKLEVLCKTIMLSLIMVDLMLFKNDKEYI